MKAFKMVETPTWTLGCDCSIIFADSEEEASEIANQYIGEDSNIEIIEIPIKKGYYYIGGYIE